jgi:RimJ/RimL family protein N-acetyltransferase
MNFTFEKDIILENEIVLLRPVIGGDAQNLLEIAIQYQHLLQYSPKQVYTKELLTEYVENALAERRNRTRYSFSIFHKQQRVYAGSTSFLNIVNADERLEIGATWLGCGFQGTGLNRHCKYLLLAYAFDNIGANRVELRTDERNIQSRRAIEKIGGKHEGILREHMLMHDGYRRNTACYSILKKEWNNMKNNFLMSRKA